MAEPTPWTHRLLWALIGAVLGAVVLYLALRKDMAPVTPSTAGASGLPMLERVVEGTEGVEIDAPQCHLGVLVAREAVAVAAENEGLLRDVRVRVGDAVEAGTVIATLDTDVLAHQLTMERATRSAAQAELNRSRLAAQRAEQELQRRQGLTDLLSQEEIEAARFQDESAKAALEAAEADLSRVTARVRQLQATLARAEIRAPFGGTVAQRYLDAGARVAPGTPVVRLITSGDLIVRFAAPPDAATALTVGDPVRIELEASLRGAAGGTIEGVVRHRAPELDSASEMVFFEAELRRADDTRLAPGAITRVSRGTSPADRSCLSAS